GLRLGRWPAVAGIWITSGGLAAGWAAGIPAQRNPQLPLLGRLPFLGAGGIAQDSSLGGLGDGVQATFHLDPLTAAMGGLLLFPAVLLLTWQRRQAREAAVAALAVAAALLT